MTILKKRVTITSFIISVFLVLSMTLIAVIAFNLSRREHTGFDSPKWKTDIASRYDMPEPARPGMHKAEILELLGNPDAVGSNKKNPSLFYLMPTTASKGIYCVYFKNDVVVNTHYDDSADDSYPPH